jgi:hypothetical protein
VVVVDDVVVDDVVLLDEVVVLAFVVVVDALVVVVTFLVVDVLLLVGVPDGGTTVVLGLVVFVVATTCGMKGSFSSNVDRSSSSPSSTSVDVVGALVTGVGTTVREVLTVPPSPLEQASTNKPTPANNTSAANTVRRVLAFIMNS